MSVILVPTAVSGLLRMPAASASIIPVLNLVPRMGGQDRVTLLGRERVERRAEDVVLHAEGHEPHL